MPSKIYSCALSGIEAYGIEIEVDILSGLSRFAVVGLPDAAVQEAKERVRSAIVNSGARFPQQRKVVNLAPADVRKCGPAFDLPIAVGLLMESGQIVGRMNGHDLAKSIFMGELALDGGLRPVNGVLSCALYAQKQGFESLFVPEENASEACLARDLVVYPVRDLGQLMNHLNGRRKIEAVKPAEVVDPGSDVTAYAIPIKGGEQALRALAIAAAGGHHLLMSGPPGSGKTLAAHHIPHLLPPLSREEVLELTKIYSVAGLLPSGRPVVGARPFRSVHSTASVVSLVGGGGSVRPGEISLAHRGVLFLDEMPEFPRYLLESLRQPLEDRSVTVARASGTFTFPANFVLVGAMNPCPCGFAEDNQKKCICSRKERVTYNKKLSGPLLDRIDLHVKMKRLSFEDMQNEENFDLSRLVDQVLHARWAQQERFKSAIHLNSDVSAKELGAVCEINPSCAKLLKRAMNEFSLTARGYSRVLKVARTLADMLGERQIHEEHLLEAIRFRLPGVS